jgi:ABC-2 type transport system permease protein
MEFIRLLKADFLKQRHTYFYKIHSLIPILGIVLFLAYYSFSSWDTITKIEAYIQAIAMAFPMLIGLICAMVVEQEALAGNFKELLSNPCGKKTTFLSKLTMLLIAGFCSTLIAIVGFEIGFTLLFGKSNVGISFYLTLTVILFSTQIFTYILHLIMSFLFGKGASIGMGIIESLVVALMAIGLGDGRWQWIYCAWPVRLSGCFMTYALNSKYFAMIQQETYIGSLMCIIVTVLCLLVSIVWFSGYEGKYEK